MLIMGSLGVVALGSVFVGSMSPSEKAKAGRSQHDLSKLEVGTYRFDHFQRDDFQFAKVLLIKDLNNKIYAHLIPTERDFVIMPERWWGWGYYHCNDFRPDIDETGRIKKNGAIRCHDKEAPEWMSKNQWLRNYSGKSIGSWMDDIYTPNNEIIGSTLYINR
jgi:hypothetical protein